MLQNDPIMVQNIEEELKDDLHVYEEYAEVIGVEPNFKIKNGETIHQYG
jgi:hypothetical protein